MTSSSQRILMVGPVPPPYGGIASVLEDIVNSELSSQYCFDVFPRTAVFPEYAKGRIGRNLFRLRRFLNFYRQASSGSYHFLHIHSADPAFPGTLIFMALARLAGLKVLLHMHGTDWDDFYEQASCIQKLIIRVGLRLPHRIMVLYALWADKIKAMVPTAHVGVMGNLVRRQESPDAADVMQLQRELGLNEDDCIILTVGSVGWRKGSFEILKAVPQVAAQMDSIRFVLVGGEEFSGDMAKLKEITAKEGLNKWVRFVGETKRDKIRLFMRSAHVFLLPSFIEGMPISIIEAMQWGVPVIATSIAAVPDMIRHDVSGLLINPGKPDEIASAVLRLASDPNLRGKLAKEAETTFSEKFEFSKGMENLRQVYESL